MAALDTDDLGDALVHVVNRSPGEQYIVLLMDGALRVFEAADGTEVPVFGPLSLGAPYTPDFTYLASPSPFRPANRSLKALTLVDYTLVLNRHVGVEMLSTTSDEDPSDTTAFIFVRAGQYSTEYKASLKLAGQSPADFKVTTWDGIAVAPGVNEVWALTITSTGAVSSSWHVSVLGNVASYQVGLGDTGADVTTALRSQINAFSGMSAGGAGTVITITADVKGQHFLPSVTPASGGTYGLIETTAGANSTELSSIETNDIAEALADQINSDERFTATVAGSVIRVDTVPITITNEVWTVRIIRKAAGTWSCTLLAQTATGSGPTTHAIAVSLGAAIDALTGVTATVNNETITITDTTPGENFFPLMSAPVGGEFEVTRIAHAGTSDTVLEAVSAEDSRAGQAILSVHHSVDAIDLLPLMCSDGFTVRIDGGTESTADDSYVKFQSDKAGDFGKGKWVESFGFGVLMDLDPETMPHALIRRQDDILGTVTGTGLAKYFEFGPIDWEGRHVGDATTAPQPSIAILPVADDVSQQAQPLSDIFFFRNRLGFVSGQKVVMSQAGNYFNLFRTTVLSLLDSDPIDILVPHDTAINISHATAFNQTLVLFSDLANFVLDGSPTLTPKTVQVSPILQYENARDAEPLPTKNGIYFVTERGDFSSVRQLLPDTQVANQFDVDNTSVAVPQYISGDVIQLAGLELEGLLLTLADGDQSKLYVYKSFRIGNQRPQQAWVRYDLGASARILGLGFIGSVLYLVVNRPDGTHLESSAVIANSVDPGALYLTRLDRRVQFDTGVFSAGRTTWTLPYEPDATATYVAVTRSPNGNDGGDVLPLTLDGGADVSADGNHSADLVWIGQTFTMRYRFPKLLLKTGDQPGQQRLEARGRLQVQHGVLQVSRTASLTAEVTPYRRPLVSKTYSGATADRGIDGNLRLGEGEFRFPVLSDDAQIDLVTSSPLPAAAQSIDFEVQYTPTFRGFR